MVEWTGVRAQWMGCTTLPKYSTTLRYTVFVTWPATKWWLLLKCHKLGWNPKSSIRNLGTMRTMISPNLCAWFNFETTCGNREDRIYTLMSKGVARIARTVIISTLIHFSYATSFSSWASSCYQNSQKEAQSCYEVAKYFWNGGSRLL